MNYIYKTIVEKEATVTINAAKKRSIVNSMLFNKAKKSGPPNIYEAKSEQLQWCRSKVIEMRAKGMSQIEIARELQVSEASISSDIAYLRNRVKETIR